MMGAMGISWTICKPFAHRSTQNHASTSSLKFCISRMLFLTPSTEGTVIGAAVKTVNAFAHVQDGSKGSSM